jgi:hypothetical protein
MKKKNIESHILDVAGQPIVFEFDDVLVDVTKAKIDYIYQNSLDLNGLVDFTKPLSDKDIISRDIRNPIEWLEAKFHNTKDGASISPKSLNFATLYVHHGMYETKPSLLSTLTPTPLASKIFSSIALNNAQAVSKIFIAIRDSDRSIIHSEFLEKYNYCKEHFTSSKVEIIAIKYPDIAKEILSKVPNFALLVTDDIGLVDDIVIADNSKREFLLPKYGYDHVSSLTKAVIAEKGDYISYYDI